VDGDVHGDDPPPTTTSTTSTSTNQVVDDSTSPTTTTTITTTSYLFDPTLTRQQPIMYWMPFFKLSSETLHLRPWNQRAKAFDCTHFCYTPYLWEPLIDSMALALEREGRRR